MAESDLIKPPVDPTAVSSVSPVGVEERVVNIHLVDGVSNGDYASSDYQVAKKAWELFVEAGIEPGFLVANGLEKGHNYPASKFSIRQPFQNNGALNLTGETKATNEGLVLYYYEIAQTINKGNLLTTSQHPEALTRRVNIFGPVIKEKVIESIIIIPAKLSKIEEK